MSGKDNEKKYHFPDPDQLSDPKESKRRAYFGRKRKDVSDAKRKEEERYLAEQEDATNREDPVPTGDSRGIFRRIFGPRSRDIRATDPQEGFASNYDDRLDSDQG